MVGPCQVGLQTEMPSWIHERMDGHQVVDFQKCKNYVQICNISWVELK